jgi:hypothetical protein
VTASPVAWSRRWAQGLPALIVLLLLLVSGGGAGRLADGPAVGSAQTALAAAPAATQPAATPRADLRLLVKRGGQWVPGPMSASGSVPVLRVAPLAGWWTVTGSAGAARHGVRGEVYQGRAPPSAA